METMNFEQLMKALEETVAKLESGQLSLEESVEVYNYGMKLTLECKKRLDEAKSCIVKKVENNNSNN